MKYKFVEIRQERWIPAVIKKEGLRTVARWAKIDPAYLSRIVNGKIMCSWEMRTKLIKAISRNRLKKMKGLPK
jgi:hypothetical protein